MASSTTPRTYGGQAVEDRRRERRERLLQAGLEVFGDEGYRNSSIAKVCATADVVRAQFYEHFTNREDLLVAVYDWIQAEAQADVLAALTAAPADAGMEERARATMTAFTRSIGNDPRRAAIMFVEIVGVSPRVEERRIARREVWAEFLRSEMQRALGDSFVPPGGYSTAAAGFIGALTGLVHHWATTDAGTNPDDIVEVATRFLVSLIRG
ncbi:TetR/AcrR family transcriptional regulator [Millisia brevis]|uniref:TetR/AcrR family transcriptional regulator n=1 Tax=Millisia brevis TaxID=264148 RepID=UPI000833CC8E|nr:TetR/AcrR family transcriptional regulator [Millisia brevis]